MSPPPPSCRSVSTLPDPPQWYTTGIASPRDAAMDRASRTWGVTCVGVTRFRLWQPIERIERKMPARLSADTSPPPPRGPVSAFRREKPRGASRRPFGQVADVGKGGHPLVPGTAEGSPLSGPGLLSLRAMGAARRMGRSPTRPRHRCPVLYRGGRTAAKSHFRPSERPGTEGRKDVRDFSGIENRDILFRPLCCYYHPEREIPPLPLEGEGQGKAHRIPERGRVTEAMGQDVFTPLIAVAAMAGSLFGVILGWGVRRCTQARHKT